MYPPPLPVLKLVWYNQNQDKVWMRNSAHIIISNISSTKDVLFLSDSCCVPLHLQTRRQIVEPGRVQQVQ